MIYFWTIPNHIVGCTISAYPIIFRQTCILCSTSCVCDYIPIIHLVIYFLALTFPWKKPISCAIPGDRLGSLDVWTPPAETCLHLSSVQNPCWLMIMRDFMRDYTTQYIGDYNNPIGESLLTDPRLVAVVARFCQLLTFLFPRIRGHDRELLVVFFLADASFPFLALLPNFLSLHIMGHEDCLAWSVLAWLFPLCLSSIYGAVRIDSHMSTAALSFPQLPIRGGWSLAGRGMMFCWRYQYWFLVPLFFLFPLIWRQNRS